MSFIIIILATILYIVLRRAIYKYTIVRIESGKEAIVEIYEGDKLYCSYSIS